MESGGSATDNGDGDPSNTITTSGSSSDNCGAAIPQTDGNDQPTDCRSSRSGSTPATINYLLK